MNTEGELNGGSLSKSLPIIFFEEFGRVSTPGSLTGFKGKNAAWAKDYFRNSIQCLINVDELQKESQLILSKISHQKDGLFIEKLLSIEELIVLLKLYLICWASMSDVMAKFISNVFDLGIADEDIRFGDVLRNKKVKKTNIQKICAKHGQIVDISRTTRKRNHVAHRGQLLDDEIKLLKEKKYQIEAERYSLLTDESDRISENEYKAKMKEYHDQLRELVGKKRKEYEDHLQKTIALNSDLTKELALVVNQHLCEIRI